MILFLKLLFPVYIYEIDSVAVCDVLISSTFLN